MLFSSTVFLFLFFPCLLFVYFVVFRGNLRLQNITLMFFSLIFYAYGEPVNVLLMIIGILVTWLGGIVIDVANGRGKTFLLTLFSFYHLYMLIRFKYLGFIVTDVLKPLGVNVRGVADIALPIGISFYTFQMMSYLFDVYYKKTNHQSSLYKLCLYISLFPQLIAGPIVRYNKICDQIDQRNIEWENLVWGLRRFLIGLGKKVLIADVLGEIADSIFTANANIPIGMITAWIGSISYTLQIYYDFSGYSDMAIGLGYCFGFKFEENFNYPYIADSVTAFWRRWHISLTSWFREYIYIPLGGNRCSKAKNILNTCVVWLLTGIWHGANWTFIIWGILYCIIQLLEKFRVLRIDRLPNFMKHIYTLFIVNICWVIFKADSLAMASNYIYAMFGKNGLADIDSYNYLSISICIVCIGIIGCTPLVKYLYHKLLHLNSLISVSVKVLSYVILVVVLLLVCAVSIGKGYSPFIYFNF